MASLSLSKQLSSLFLVISMVGMLGTFINIVGVDGATSSSSSSSSSSTWCVARSDATTQALQTALDYACGAGADCSPLQSTGLCYLPNTIQAHASYAFNSYYQRKAMAPGSCDFSGTSTIAQTDPSYGSCVYPSSASTAGGTTTPTTPPATGIFGAPTTPTTPTFGGGSVTGFTPMTPTIPESDDNSKASLESMIPTILMHVSFMFVLSFTLN
ncbi:unnamed protein product [Prunus armeniaca]|uniref:X8 domain-containing protein n=1 Tax=Prunus armeniaca TaxID=36596 RepID=A0A6J5TDK8_PRUAR|nr:unnamed protein product [Prunus armeniaca]